MKMRDGLLQLRYNLKTGKWYKDKPTKEKPYQMTVYFLSDNVCPICKDRFFYCSGNPGKYCSESCSTTQRNYNNGISEETAKKISKSNIGIKRNIPLETQKRLSEYRRIRMLGKKNPAWIDGRSATNGNIYRSKRYKSWRKDVFERDNYTCVLCKSRGGKLEAHHIKKFSEYPELRFDINNGVTLCYNCHHTEVHCNEDDYLFEFNYYIKNLTNG